MSVFEPNSRHLQEFLIFCFHLKKTATEVHRMLSSTYYVAALSERTHRKWFQRFKSSDFDVKDQHGGLKKNIFEDSETCQIQEELAESLGDSKRHFETSQSHRNYLETKKFGSV